MNEIDLPTMTKSERRLMVRKNERPWWQTMLMVATPGIFIVTVSTLVLTFHDQKSQFMPEGIRINPNTAICASHEELFQSGWTRVPESDRQRIAADARYRILSAQTIVCTDGSQSFQLREWWYKQEKSTWRRQGLAVHKE